MSVKLSNSAIMRHFYFYMCNKVFSTVQDLRSFIRDSGPAHSEECRLTALFAVETAAVLIGALIDLLLLLSLATFVEVLDDHTDEHVEHKETDE